MKLDVKTLPTQLLAQLDKIKKYFVFAYIVFVILGLAFLAFRINTLSSQEPSSDEVAEKAQRVPQPKIDQKSIDKINQLQSQNVEVQSLFDSARDNPFNE